MGNVGSKGVAASKKKNAYDVLLTFLTSYLINICEQERHKRQTNSTTMLSLTDFMAVQSNLSMAINTLVIAQNQLINRESSVEALE